MTRGGLAAAIVVLLVAAVCIRLGVWQLHRLGERRALNAAYTAALALPPLELTPDSLAAVLRRPDDYVYRRARVVGTPAAGSEIVWRGRSLDGRPGVNVLTPYVTRGGPTVLVNRGWVPSPDAARVDLREFRGSVASRPAGVLVPLPSAPERARPALLGPEERTMSVQHPDPTVLSRHLATPVLPLYVQQAGPSDAVLPAALPAPDPSDEGPHMGYAIQWFSFAAIAILGFIAVLVLRSGRPPP